MRLFLDSRLGHESRLWPALLLAIFAIKALVTITLKSNFPLASTGSIAYFLLILLSSIFSFRNAAKGAIGTRLFWVFVGCGCGLWALDQSVYLYYGILVRTDVPDSSIADPSLFLHIVPYMAAIAIQPHRERIDQRPSRATVNLLILLFFWIFLYVYALFPYQYLFADDRVYNPRFTLLYAVENSALILALAVSAFRASPPWKRLYLNLFAAAALYGISSTLSNVAIDLGRPYNGTLYSLAQTGAACWFVWISLLGKQLHVVETGAVEPEIRSGFISFLAKMAVLAIPLIGIRELLAAGGLSGVREFRLLVVLVSVLLIALAVFLKDDLTRRDLVLEWCSSKTQKMLSEAALVRSERRYGELVESIPAVVWLADPVSFDLTFVNQQAERLIGYSMDELRQPGFWKNHIQPEDQTRVTEANREALADKGWHEVEYRMRSREGQTVWLHNVLRATNSSAQTELLGVAIDITDRKSATAALEATEHRLEILYEKSPIGISMMDAETGQFLQVNPKYCEIAGHSEEELLGCEFQSLLHPDDRDEAIEKMSELWEGMSQRVEIEKRCVRPDGSTRWVSIAVVRPLVEGKLASWNMSIVQDVTELKEVSEKLQQAREKLAQEKIYLEREVDAKFRSEDIIGRSQGLRNVLKQAAFVAPGDSTVLLLGETGTGKELVARAIHRQSKRQAGAFIKMNCAAVPEGLLESELFGHEKGAFTGAVARKLGRFELADNGTLFLDEIGEIPLSLQPKLLRVLQDREFERLGGTRTLKVDFRLIAATNRDLQERIQEKEFRSDLYYRLNVFPIRIPPLCERRQDIPLLAKHFVEKFALRLRRPITTIPEETLDALVRWHWPGNIRELENFIERAVILTTGSVLMAPLGELNKTNTTTPDTTLAEFERNQILRAVGESGGRISPAASRLGVPRTTLQSKLKKLGIDRHKI